MGCYQETVFKMHINLGGFLESGNGGVDFLYTDLMAFHTAAM